jgi:hypothetical protein
VFVEAVSCCYCSYKPRDHDVELMIDCERAEIKRAGHPIPKSPLLARASASRRSCTANRTAPGILPITVASASRPSPPLSCHFTMTNTCVVLGN